MSKFLELSSKVGTSFFMCQHKGGNTSFKENSDITIKASGTSLCDSLSKPEFVFLSSTNINDGRKASIEAPLHRVLPHKYVFHFHPVDFLVLSVLDKCHLVLKEIQSHYYDVCSVDLFPYLEPGQQLADAISFKTYDPKTPSILLLENHGVVVASDSLTLVDSLIDSLMKVLTSICSTYSADYIAILGLTTSLLNSNVSNFTINLSDFHIHEKYLQGLLKMDSFFYPDHAVFFKSILNLFCFGSSVPLSYSEKFTLIIDDNSCDVVMPQVKSVEQRQHMILILHILLSVASFDPCTLKLLGSDTLESLVNSEAEQYRAKLS